MEPALTWIKPPARRQEDTNFVKNVTQTEVAASLNALRGFARVCGIAEGTAVEVYERELRQLGSGAVIDRFVAVIAEKHAKDALRARVGPRFVRSAAARVAA
jgi:hypothetical protein